MNTTGRQTLRAALAGSVTEDEFEDTLLQIAMTFGWRAHHARPARRADGQWRTPIKGHKGFPDLVLARAGRVIIAELKSEKGRVSPEQDAWLDDLGYNLLTEDGQAVDPDRNPEVYVWRPSQMSEIVEILR